ncbi:unnamed protein product [Hyaloperonospora brassicae]|uniref:FYVE-type domain-containing protein n=1 Tax=Hyaloperonospora brassicae TaxID=162125 RepID=A0AAV0US85_HYABA|nr:unnamed protein product [Hyaloperonospora brassicae]
MRAPHSAAEASKQALLQDNANCVAHVLQSHFFTRAASPSVSSSYERVASRPPINVRPYVHTRDCGGRRRSTAASCEAVLGTLQDAMHALHADNTSSYRRVESDLFGADRLLDACVLETLVARTKETPYRYVGLKHVKYQSLVGDERHAEEFLLMETAGKGVHPSSGHKFVFKMLRSVDVPDKEFELRSANSHHAQLQVHRGAIHALLVVLAETGHRGILKMQLWLDVELTKCAEPFYGAFSSLHDAYSLSIRYRHVVERYAVTSGETAAGAVGPSNGCGAAAAAGKTSRFELLAHRSDRERKCQTCQRALGFFARKKNHLCSVCGIFVCSSCLSSTSFENWKLCGLCYQRNKSFVTRTRVSKISSLASGLGETLQYISRIGRSHSRQRDSILFATAEAAGELPPTALLQDTKHGPTDRCGGAAAAGGRRRCADDDAMLFENDVKPLARSVVGVRRAVRPHAAPVDAAGRSGRRPLPPPRGSSSRSRTVLSESHHHGRRRAAGRSRSCEPFEDTGSGRGASGSSSADRTSGSFRTSELSHTPVRISTRSSSSSTFVEPTADALPPSTDSKPTGGSTTSDSTTSSGSGEPQDRSDAPAPAPDLLRVGPQRVPAPAPAPAGSVDPPRTHNYPPRRANHLHCVTQSSSDSRRSRGSTSSRSSRSSSSHRSPSRSPSPSPRRSNAFKVWASASAGPRMVTQKSSSSRGMSKLAADYDSQMLSNYCGDSYDGPIKRSHKPLSSSSSNVSAALEDQPQHGGRLYEWI